MTLAIAVVSADGIVLAADSRTTVQLGPAVPTRVLSDFTHKVFRIGDSAIGTYGWAFLQRRNIAGHMAEFEASLEEDPPGGIELADRLAEFFGNRIDQHLQEGLDQTPPEGVDPLGFLIGGYEDGVGQTREVTLPSRTVTELHDSVTNPGAAWRGQTDVIVRLVKGVDLDSLYPLANQDGKGAELQALQATLQGLEYLIPFNEMNIQDAVDFAVFAIRTTIDTQRLTHGIARAPGSWPGVGGPIEIAAITAIDGFQWVQQAKIQADRPPGEAERA